MYVTRIFSSTLWLSYSFLNNTLHSAIVLIKHFLRDSYIQKSYQNTERSRVPLCPLLSFPQWKYLKQWLQPGNWHPCSQHRESLMFLPFPCSPPPFPPPPFLALATTSLFSLSVILSFQQCYIKGILLYVTFGIRSFFSLSRILWRFIWVVVCISSLLFCIT